MVVGLNVGYVFAILLFEMFELGPWCRVGLVLVISQKYALPVVGEQVMNDFWVGNGRGIFTFWCDGARWWDVICSDIFICVPSICFNPVIAGVFFYVGGCLSDMCGGVPSICSWRVSIIL